MIILVPAILAALILVAFLMDSESKVILLILFLFAFVARAEEGFQIEELVFAAAYFGFLAYWFSTRLIDPASRIVKSATDLALLLFFIYATLTIVLSFMYGSLLHTWISEWVVIASLLFYFPVRDYCISEPNGRQSIVLMIAWIAGLTLVRNFVIFVNDVQSAEYIWQIATARVPENEHLLMFTGIGAVVWYSIEQNTWRRVLAFVATALLTVGVLIGQSRAVWVSYALGIATVCVASASRARRRIVVALVASFAVALFAGWMLAPDILTLLIVGVVDRFASLGSAATDDLSLLNRFQENRAVLSYIASNPIVGHGLGSPYRYYSLVYEATRETSFIHSWYLGTLYRHGIVGCLLFYPVYIAAIVQGFRVFRRKALSVHTRSIGLFVAAGLIAESLAATTETTFGTSDKPLFLALMFALVFSVALPSHVDQKEE